MNPYDGSDRAWAVLSWAVLSWAVLLASINQPPAAVLVTLSDAPAPRRRSRRVLSPSCHPAGWSPAEPVPVLVHAGTPPLVPLRRRYHSPGRSRPEHLSGRFGDGATSLGPTGTWRSVLVPPTACHPGPCGAPLVHPNGPLAKGGG
ncbi:hypothetical protein GCM10009760_23700 [Kitasatospora kazusensis]|uniref:Secreted protein n=1 Tax=Kitasatospora kazusensis TaxID=407974 RepID=A0ABP5L1K8_9ACTN